MFPLLICVCMYVCILLTIAAAIKVRYIKIMSRINIITEHKWKIKNDKGDNITELTHRVLLRKRSFYFWYK